MLRAAMTAAEREHHLMQAFVGLSDTLVHDFDVLELLQDLVEHCVQLLPVDAAGILLTDRRGRLHVMAFSGDHTELVELFQPQAIEGPCLDCINNGAPVSVPEISDHTDQWPRYVPAVQGQGFNAVDVVPLRLRDHVIGAMNLFRTHTGAMLDADLHVAQALADVATIGILSERAIDDRNGVVAQLQGALGSRVLIEQAKGILAASGATLSMDDAFKALRAHARNSGTRISKVATDLTNGDLTPATVLANSQERATREYQ